MDRSKRAPRHALAGLEPLTYPFEVRDYECDLQGIVNNAVYAHYLEHARHQFLKRHGFSFSTLTREGIHLVVVRAELEYKAPLRSGDRFVVESTLARTSPVRFTFYQRIYREAEGPRVLALTAAIVCAAKDRRGRPILPTVLEPLFAAASGSGEDSAPRKHPSRA